MKATRLVLSAGRNLLVCPRAMSYCTLQQVALFELVKKNRFQLI